MSYREAAEAFWGEAGLYAYDTYTRLRHEHFPSLPAQIPIVIGITAYSSCLGLTRSSWEHGPRITLESRRFAEGRCIVDDVLTHEMLHVWLAATGRETRHDSAGWYEAVQRLSPAVLGHEISVRRGADRKSVRVPNPAYTEGSGQPKTVVRKVRTAAAVPHSKVAGWPGSFRPDDYDWGKPVPCPVY